MYCPHCGEELPENAVYCGNCGTKIKKKFKPDPIIAFFILAISVCIVILFLRGRGGRVTINDMRPETENGLSGDNTTSSGADSGRNHNCYRRSAGAGIGFHVPSQQ